VEEHNVCVQPSIVIMNSMTWQFATAVEPTEIGSFVILDRNVGTAPENSVFGTRVWKEFFCFQ
jgi:hypothetical protein